MSAKDAIAQFEQAVEALRRSADLLAAGIPAVKSEIAASAETKEKLDKTTKMLLDAEANLSRVSSSMDVGSPGTELEFAL